MMHTMYEALCYRDWQNHSEQAPDALTLLTHDLVDTA